MVQHEPEALLGNVASSFAVDLVTEFHVVGRNRLGDGARRTPSLEKMASNFLPGTDLSERAVFWLIEVDCQGFTIRR